MGFGTSGVLPVCSQAFLLVPGEDEEMADLMEDMGVRSVSTSSDGGLCPQGKALG